MASQYLVDLKARMDELVRSPEFFGTPFERVRHRWVFNTAIRNFRRADATLLEEATPYLWAYYRSVAAEFDPEERAEYGVPELDDTVDIWGQVTLAGPPRIARGGGRLEPGASYLSFEGEVTWEPEHGLQLVFEHGLRVCKVGPYDDHNTIAHAYGREDLLGVVFK